MKLKRNLLQLKFDLDILYNVQRLEFECLRRVNKITQNISTFSLQYSVNAKWSWF